MQIKFFTGNCCKTDSFVKVLINSENKVLYCVALKGAETLANRASKELYLPVKNFICIDHNSFTFSVVCASARSAEVPESETALQALPS